MNQIYAALCYLHILDSKTQIRSKMMEKIYSSCPKRAGVAILSDRIDFQWTFIAGLFITAQQWQQFKYPWTNEWINKMWYYTVLSGHKRNEVYQHAKVLKILC